MRHDVRGESPHEGDVVADLLAGDPEVTKYLSGEKLDETFSAGRQLKNIDKLFARVFKD